MNPRKIMSVDDQFGGWAYRIDLPIASRCDSGGSFDDKV